MPASDDKRSIELSTPLGNDVLLFERLTGSERLGEPFRYEIRALSERGDIDGTKLLGQPVSVKCALPSCDTPRYVHGLVTDVSQIGYGERFHQYQLVVRPWFWFLTQTSDCCVYQALTVPAIFEKVAKKYGFTDYRLELKATYQTLAYCVQYRETAFNFLSRLLEQEGIYYFFEHTAQKHTLVLVDDSATHEARPGYDEVPFYPPSTEPNRRERDHLDGWTFVRSVQPGAYATTDFDLKTPATSLLKKQSRALKQAHADFEMFDYPAELPIDGDTDGTALVATGAETLAKVRLQELQASQMVAQGQGNAIGLATGSRFRLEQHPRENLNAEYLVVGTRLSLASNAYETGSDPTPDMHVAIEAIEMQTQFRPPRVTPKPVIQGAQTATVVGKKGEEIDTDELGRIKIQFHWDRVGKKDENSSCRVRVAQDWAGKNWGSIYIPRIGHEVIVSFLEGDPDRPIVTGCVYNGDLKPPYTLPANATQSGVKTRSAKSGGEKNFNEIRFEDKKGSELLHIHAEKDLTIDVENNATWRIGLDEDKAKAGTGDLKMIVSNTADMQVEESLNVKVKNKFVKVDAGEEITLVTGQSEINMKKDGTITITCMKFIVKATDLIELKSDNNAKMTANNAVNIEAKATLSAKSAQSTIEGQAQMNIKGAMTKVEGSGMLDLSAGGIASLKGALTKIG
jgi:type VI secretion system secreted protein VgrG